MNKKALTIYATLGLLLLGACASSSLPPSSSSEDVSSSEVTSSSSSSEEPSSSSSSSSETPIVGNELIFARGVSVPELPNFPLVETNIYIDNVLFKFNGAKNYGATANLEAQSSAFKLFNIDSLDKIYSIEVNLYQPKTTNRFTMFAGTSADPAITIIPFTKIGALQYIYDFSGQDYTHFSFLNGVGVMYVSSIKVYFSEDFVYPEGPNTGGSGTVYEPGAQGYYIADAENQTIDPQEYWYQADRFPLPSLGTQKILVVPVIFQDYPMSSGARATRSEEIRRTFFGTSEETAWESVSSYFYKSSYGKLTLTGEVTDFFEAPYTANNFDALTRSTGDYSQYFNPTWQLGDEVVAWYKSLPGSDISQYDNNGDGYVDSLVMIYNNPNKTNANYTRGQNSEFWAYVYWNYANYHAWDDRPVDSNDALPMTYSFISYDFMYEGYGTSNIDAHTYIHETGHLLGISDYYTYTDGDWGAAGALDMQDNNILDHNPYSKLLWQWVTPIVIDGTKEVTTIELSPYQDTGEIILINDGWNGSAFDNYLALEFYTPTGLNEKDSQSAYPGNNIQGFTEAGIKLYHIDSRIGRYNVDGAGNETYMGVVDTLQYGNDHYSYIITSNSSGRTDFPYFKTVHLLESSGLNTFINGNRATNDTLFQEGDTFSPSKHFSAFPIFEIYDKDNLSGKFNSNEDIGYEIEIISITATKAIVEITRIV
jgi:M6 family metalloprotease-like protein